MAKIMVTVVLLIVLWFGLSIAMMWPPVCSYAGEFNACINNLRQIDAAKRLWALETGRTNGPVIPAQLDKWYFHDRPLACPSGGTYTYGDIGQPPVCSLSTNAAPPPLKERSGPFGWRWKIKPSPGPQAHRYPM